MRRPGRANFVEALSEALVAAAPVSHSWALSVLTICGVPPETAHQIRAAPGCPCSCRGTNSFRPGREMTGGGNLLIGGDAT